MTDNVIVFKWDITKRKNNIDDQQNISIEFISDYMKVISMQNHSNPGIVFSGSLKTIKDKVYTFYIEFKSCRDDCIYLWGYNVTKKTEIFTNYKFLNGKEKFVNFQTEYHSDNGDEIRYGILFHNPNLGDLFYLKRFLVIQSSKQIIATQPVESQSVNKTVTELNFKETQQSKSHSDVITNNNSKSMFRHLKPFKLTNDQQKGLVSNFIIRNDEKWINKNMPLGYNFALMFLIHDMTFNQNKTIFSGSSVKRIPSIDLELLYGNDTSYGFLYRNYQFIYNRNKNDLPRNIYGEPMIPDKRNDHNYILAQFHILFMMFHNKLFSEYKRNNKSNHSDLDIFKLVKKEITYYWQWIIVNDILPRLVDNEILQAVFQKWPEFYKPNPVNEQYIPYEFIYSVSRFGHYVLPNRYNIAYDYFVSMSDTLKHTKGTLPEHVIDWNKFFHIDQKLPEPQYAKKIDYSQLFNIFDNIGYVNMIAGDLVASNNYNLPSGQEIASEIKFEKIPTSLMKKYDHNQVLTNLNLTDSTPLLVYILKEAEIYADGQQLIGVGGKIFAETILGTIFYDPNSYLNSKVKWLPSLKSDVKNTFTISDMIKYIYT